MKYSRAVQELEPGRWQMIRRHLLRVAAGILALVFPLVLFAAQPLPAKRVLILNSYHAGYKGSDDLVLGITEVLRATFPTVDIKIEYLDAKNYSGPMHDKLVLDTLRIKYQKSRFDLLLSTDDYAFNLLEKQRDAIFGMAPLVFCGTNYFNRDRIRGRSDFAGIDESPSFADTIRLILDLHPDTRQIVVIRDDSETGRLNNQAFEHDAGQFASRVGFSGLAGKRLDELRATVGKFQPGTVAIYFASFVVDADDQRISSVDALRQLAAASPVPIYGGWEFNLGHGIVGGRLVELREHGRAAGRLATKVLAGESPQQRLGVLPSPNPFMFDFVQLQRFGIAESQLPADSKIINRPPTFLDKYGIYLLLAFSTVLLIAVITAVAKLMASRRALERSQRKFATIFRTSPDLLAITDRRSGRFLQVNDAFTRIMGYAAEEVIGHTSTELGTWGTATARQEMFAALGSANRLENYETLFRRKNGEVFSALLSLEEQIIDGTACLLITARDITERKQMEEELRRSNVELEHFSYAISHDMRQPLRMIASYLKLLDMELGDQLDEEKREFLNFAKDGAKRLDQMLVDLLEYSRVGRSGEPPAWIESREVLDEVLLFLQPAIVEARADVRIQGSWPRIFARPDGILRLLQNLIANAIKFRIAGRTPEITLSSEIRAANWCVRVADNGAGVIPDQMGRLFQVFQRLQSRAKYEGTGIGLAMCRKIVEQHGGRIWVESEGEGKGSQFCFMLPQKDSEAPAQQA